MDISCALLLINNLPFFMNLNKSSKLVHLEEQRVFLFQAIILEGGGGGVMFYISHSAVHGRRTRWLPGEPFCYNSRRYSAEILQRRHNNRTYSVVHWLGRCLS